MSNIKNIKNIKNNKTIKHKKNYSIIVVKFIEFLNIIKLFHWKTKSYSVHINTDNFYDSLNTDIDKFVETLLGKYNIRLNINNTIKLIDINDKNILVKKINEFKKYLLSLNDLFIKNNDDDILNILDDILSSINKFLFLLTLN